ncbi:MAG: hypothetical protein DI533_00410 [Cereibacter sphaeroides]|uniref:Uncharacterized protein n=1 Tax=Cereibacter sphaeroides TaxID=1063 RepID=A0A2W5SIR9_CERSP|nr:MAG: hypothetical protein DI533_00410 [Cereibacter sphaeroides]
MSFSKNYAIDAATGLIKREPAQAAVAASGYIGTQHDQGAATATDMMLIANIEAITVGGATPENYRFRMVGSNLANRSDSEIIGEQHIGGAAQVGTGETRSAAAGDRVVLPFRTEKNRTKFRYVDLYLLVAGTAPSITFSAYVTKEI